jgi:hypothetical protein
LNEKEKWFSPTSARLRRTGRELKSGSGRSAAYGLDWLPYEIKDHKEWSDFEDDLTLEPGSTLAAGLWSWTHKERDLNLLVAGRWNRTSPANPAGGRTPSAPITPLSTKAGFDTKTFKQSVLFKHLEDGRNQI